MKIYPKRFEDVFQREYRGSFKVDGEAGRKIPNHVLSFEDLKFEQGIYLAKQIMDEYDLFIFDSLIKSSWLRAKMRIDGLPILEEAAWRKENKISKDSLLGVHPVEGRGRKISKEAYRFNRASIILDNTLGRQNRFSTKTDLNVKALASYVHSFFPRKDFLAHNPFTETEYFKYPYRHVGLEFLIFVHQIDDRMEILDLAEREKWKFKSFQDWVVNHVYSINMESGKDQYVLKMKDMFHPIPFIVKNKFKAKYGTKI